MPLCFCILHSTRFWFERRGFAVINIDIISYFVVKNMILRFRPWWVYPVGKLICNHGNMKMSVMGQEMRQRSVGNTTGSEKNERGGPR